MFISPAVKGLGRGTVLGTPIREPQQSSRNILKYIRIYLHESLNSTMFLLYSWGSLLGVPVRTFLLAMRNHPEDQTG